MIEPGQEFASSAGFVLREGTESATRRRLALKCLKPHLAADPTVARRFREEGRRLAGVRHPHVIEVLGVEEIGGEIALVMERADHDLRAMVAAGGAAPEAVVAILTQATQGLQALGRAGIEHGGINPGNVLLLQGQAKIGDLGAGAAGGAGATLVDVAPRYAAPELLGGGRAEGEKAAIYALGLLGYELVAGAARVDDLVRELMGGRGDIQSDWMRWPFSPKDLPPLADVVPGTPPGLSRAIQAMLRKDPAQRASGHAAVLELLARWREDAPAAAPAAPPKPASAGAPTELRDRGPVDPTLLVDRPNRAPAAAAAPAARAAARPAPEPEPAAAEETGGWSMRRKLIVGGVLVWAVALAWVFWPSAPVPTVSIDSTPPGARVTLGVGGRELGKTPIRLNGTVPPDVVLVFSLDGYEEGRVTTQAGQSRIQVTLEPKPAAPAPPPAAPAAPAAASGPSLPTAWDLAQRILAVGRPVFPTHLEAFPFAAPDSRLPRPVSVGTRVALRLESAEAGATLVFHIASDATITVLYPHQRTGPLAVTPGPPRTLPVDSTEALEILPPAGREWMFAVTTPRALQPPIVLGSSTHESKWLILPLEAPGPLHPALAFVDWLEESLRTPGTRWSMAHVEWEVADSASTTSPP